MTYRDQLIANSKLAEKELESKLASLVPPPVYDWDEENEYHNLPTDLKESFNQLVLSAIGKGDRETKSGITLLGAPGVGKTRAVFAMARELVDQVWAGEEIYAPECEANIIEHVEWVAHVRALNRYGDPQEERNFTLDYVKTAETYPGFLFVDDIGVAAMPDFVSEKFYTLVDHRLKNRRPTIFVSNATPDELAQSLDPRISHRLLRWTRVIQFLK